jgi:voltage-gated potassium channel Kch
MQVGGPLPSFLQIVDTAGENTCGAIFRDGRVELDEAVDWSDGQRLVVVPVAPPLSPIDPSGHVIIVGFGLAGRCVADLLDSAQIPYVIVEKNSATVATQSALGRRIFQGNVSEESVLMEAGLASASILALTIPDEDAVLAATSLARRLRPEIYIIARTQYASKGMAVSQLGADDVIKAEHAVALQFYDHLRRRLGVGGNGTVKDRTD